MGNARMSFAKWSAMLTIYKLPFCLLGNIPILSIKWCLSRALQEIAVIYPLMPAEPVFRINGYRAWLYPTWSLLCGPKIIQKCMESYMLPRSGCLQSLEKCLRHRAIHCSVRGDIFCRISSMHATHNSSPLQTSCIGVLEASKGWQHIHNECCRFFDYVPRIL